MVTHPQMIASLSAMANLGKYTDQLSNGESYHTNWTARERTYLSLHESSPETTPADLLIPSAHKAGEHQELKPLQLSQRAYSP